MDFDRLLISTKFAPPRIGAHYLPRRQLLDHLRETQRCTFTLITGSAGFGKTILLAQWRQELMKSGAEVAWLSLSHDDKRLPNFCAYLLAALQRLGIPVEDDMLLEGGSSKSIDSVVAVTVGGAANIPKELYLIIDDYHYVEDQWTHKLMQKLLDHCPANLHIVIASRAAPPLSISRLRVLGQVAEVGFAELPFNLDETRVFFEQNLTSLKLTADELRLIHDVTHGWPASLQLVAIMLRNRPETRSTLRDLGWKSTDLQAWLAEDVVAHLPAELTEFLEAISACRRFNAGLAAFVTENADAASLIKRAEDENLLIYRVESDDRSPWYRFHPLFGDFLAARLSRRGEPAAQELHRRASQWFADHDFLIEAVRHAILGGDLDFAVEAIEHAAPTTWSLGYISPMLHLLDRLPQETLFAHPRLFFLGCLTFALTARPEKAERWLVQIRQSDAAKNPAVSSQLALADAAVAVQRDDTKRAIDLLEPQAKFSPENRFLRYVYLAALVSAYAAGGRYADAHKLLDDNPVPPEDRKNDMALVVESARASTFLLEGNVREAARIGSAVLALSETAYGRRSVCANLCAASLSDAYYELDRIDDAREMLANRSGILQFSSPQVMVRAALAHARLDLLQESPEAALAFLATHAAHYHSLRLDRPEAYMLAEQAKILLAKGDRVRAAELTAKLSELGALHAGAEGFRAEIPMIAALARARLSLNDYAPREALEALALVRRYAERYGRARVEIRARILSALALDDLEQRDEMVDCLVEALQSGSRLGLLRTFLDEGKRVGELLARVRGDPRLDTTAAAYLDDLLRMFGGAETAGARNRSGPGKLADERASLTPRELEILSLISQAMSNKRIALTLNITLETVKWNVKNILAKLGVSSRYDAMTWARKQGLIE
jgi:LuxR family maltose regulon positive regulatory protein